MYLWVGFFVFLGGILRDFNILVLVVKGGGKGGRGGIVCRFRNFILGGYFIVI